VEEGRKTEVRRRRRNAQTKYNLLKSLEILILGRIILIICIHI
jgi:hypothetical protein